MLTLEVEILEPKAKKMLDEMESENLIKISMPSGRNGLTRKPLKRGCMKGMVLNIDDDFDEPLKDFEEYM